jgi:hypothetical protein
VTGRWTRLTRRWLAGLILFALISAVAITISLQGTPLQTVTVAGQVIEVGASARFTRSSACCDCPAFKSFCASSRSSARADVAPKKAQAQSKMTPRRNPPYSRRRGAVEFSIVLYFQGPT